MRKSFSPLAAAAVAAVVGLTAARPAAAQYKVTLTQTATGVSASGVGSIDLAGLTFTASGGMAPSVLGPTFGTILTGTQLSLADAYDMGQLFPTFGSGLLTTASDPGTGDYVGVLMFPGATSSILLVPTGYAGGTALAGTSFYAGQTYASLGVTPGTYSVNWDNGEGSFTLDITPASTTTPEPGTWALLGTGLVGVGVIARRRRA